MKGIYLAYLSQCVLTLRHSISHCITRRIHIQVLGRLRRHDIDLGFVDYEVSLNPFHRKRELCSRLLEHVYIDDEDGLGLVWSGAEDESIMATSVRTCNHFVDISRQVADHADHAVADFLKSVNARADFSNLRFAARQLVQESRDHLRNVNQAWDMLLKMNSSVASRKVTRFTYLATCFLPLSLSSAMLSMNRRLEDLGILAFDFIGTSVVLATAAVLVYVFLTLFTKFYVKHRSQRKQAWRAPRSKLERQYIIMWAVVCASGVSIIMLAGMLQQEIHAIFIFLWVWAGIVIILGLAQGRRIVKS